MDELINLMAEKTSLSPELSKQVVNIVLDFLQQKLPAPIAGQIDAALGSGAKAGVADAIGGLVGKKK